MRPDWTGPWMRWGSLTDDPTWQRCYRRSDGVIDRKRGPSYPVENPHVHVAHQGLWPAYEEVCDCGLVMKYRVEVMPQ